MELYSTTQTNWRNQPVKVITDGLTLRNDAAGNVYTSAYDLSGRKISDSDAKGNTTAYVYDKLDRIIKTTSPFDAGRTSEIKSYYDGNNNLVKQLTKRSENEYSAIEYKYNNMNSVIAAIGDHGENDSVVQTERSQSMPITITE